MKFLFAALALVLAGVWASPAKAQVHTYLSEDFSQALGASKWNLDSCTKVNKTSVLHYLKDQSGNGFGGWWYDPKNVIGAGVFNDTIKGTYQLVSNPIRLKGADTVNVVTVNYQFGAQAYTGRKFAVCVREKDGASWEKLREITDSKEEMNDGVLVVALPAKWSGKTVELAVMFTAPFRANSAYYFIMDDVLFSAYANIPKVNLKNYSAPVVHGGVNAKMKLRVQNSGAVNVTAMEFTYTVDQAAAASTSETFEKDGIEYVLGVADVSLELTNTNQLTPGWHKAKIWASKLNGSANAKIDTMGWDFYVPDESKLTQTYVPLFESFTSATCGPCATANNYLNPVQEELHKAGALNIVKYQMDFPGNGDKYYIAGNGTRWAYYSKVIPGGLSGVPSPIYNGMEHTMYDWDIQTWTDLQDMLRSKATEEHKNKAVMEIKIKQADVPDGSAKRLNLEFDVTPTFDVNGRVFAVLVEKTTTKNRGSNGEKEFHYVTIDFPINANGSVKSFKAGQTETFKVEGRSLGSTKMEEVTDLEVVCFVQHESGYIFQSASTIVTTPASNQNNAALAPVRMYPNPATDEVTLQGLTKADISLIDLTGRVVYQTKGVDGDLDIDLKSLNSGTYMVRISQNGNTGFKKLIVK